MNSNVIFTNSVHDALAAALDVLQPASVVVLVDENTRRHVLPQLEPGAECVTVMTIPADEEHKTLHTAASVWHHLQESSATRRTVMVNVGGGVVTDLGGFCASTFKRGISFINVPTTLLAAVDASVGGKTGVDFGGLKNEVGTFALPAHVIISTCFFNTLPERELLSGFAEMLKHAMLTGADEVDTLLDLNPCAINWQDHLPMVEASVGVKQRIVEQDPHERGMRRALNLGHTVGHAFESFALQQGRPLSHGHAVACGLVAEAVLSHMVLGFKSSCLYHLAQAVRGLYDPIPLTCDDYPALLKLMKHDKKSHHGELNCTLLRAYGDVAVGVTVDNAGMEAALDIYRDLMGM